MTNFIVNSLEDTVIVDDKVTLREAIEAANTNTPVGDAPAGMPGLDTIDFDELLSGETITLTNGELQITDDLTINGLGADELTVSGNNASRVFNVDGGTSDEIEVLIDGLTIADGFAEGDFFTGRGGGILNQENLTVTNSTLSGNTGSGIYSQDGDLTVTDSSISGNTAEFGGGGISVYHSSEVRVINSTISGNMADGDGGGLLAFYGSEVQVINSTISGNTANQGGGGISADESIVQVTNSTISGNTAANQGGGGISADYNIVQVTNSTISGNTADRNGGGISTYGVYLPVINSTISGNTADQGGGISADDGGEVQVTNSTISDNTADQGGGISADDVREVQVTNTIIAGNNGSNPDVEGVFTSEGYNLIGDGTGSTGFTAPGDQVGTSDNPIDPKLGPLQDNGGPTETQALLPDSPAIDAADPNFISPPDFDQRGPVFIRVSDGNGDSNAILDIGAFEFASEPNIIDGTSGNDLLPGTPSNDRINGFGGNDLLIGNQNNDLLIGGGDRDRFAIAAGDGTDAIPDFGGVGTGINPSQAVIDEVDTIEFFGSGLTPENMLLTPNGPDLEIAFEGVEDTKVILQNFKLEDLDNLTTETGASVTIGNILFDGQIEIEDSFDVFNANDNRRRVFNRNTVTFLNDLDNNTKGFSKSNDVINGQGGRDTLEGLSGDDLLRGGPGFDTLTGNSGADQFSFSTSRAFSRSDVGIDDITDFKPAQADKIVLSKTTFTALTSDAGGPLDPSEFEAVDNFDDAESSSAFITYLTSTGRLFYNQNGADDGFSDRFEDGGSFADLEGNPTISAADFLVTD